MPGHVVIAVLGNTYFLHSLLPYLSMNIFCTPSFLTFLGIFFTLPLSFLFYDYLLHSLVPYFSRNIFFADLYLKFSWHTYLIFYNYPDSATKDNYFYMILLYTSIEQVNRECTTNLYKFILKIHPQKSKQQWWHNATSCVGFTKINQVRNTI